MHINTIHTISYYTKLQSYFIHTTHAYIINFCTIYHILYYTVHTTGSGQGRSRR